MSRRFVRGATPTVNNGNNKWSGTSSRDVVRGRGRGRGRGLSFSRGGQFSRSFVRNNEAPITTSNKWVRPVAAATDQQLGDDNGILEADNKNTETKIEDVIVPAAGESKNEETTDTINKSDHTLERRGRHKLVGVKKKEESSTLSNNQKSITDDNSNYSWKRKSAEMSAQSNDEEIIDSTKPQTAVQNESKGAELSRTTQHLKRKHPDKIHGPRRICLSTAIIEDEGKDADQTDAQSKKTLTDFQYKDTSARGRGRGKTMGLVRVKRNNIPICPTFSRGLPCNNAKCNLRHDVSTEASRPMCVFFQRNGMCSKGDDCPFKHIKISWDAEICPTFERLGYCEDESCVLRHVVSKKKSKPNAIDKR